MGFSAFTWFHTIISLAAIVAGFVVVIEMLRRRRPSSFWIATFLVLAVATSITGFGFPFTHFLPSHWVAVIALVILALVIIGHYIFGQSGAWHWIYVLGSVASLYLLVFVLIAQAFQKVPALHALAPTQSEPPFAITQIAGLVIFVVLGYAAMKGSRLTPPWRKA